MSGEAVPRAALWITAEPPSVHRGGGNIRQAHLLSRLAATVPTDLVVAGAGTDAALLAAVRTVVEVPPGVLRQPNPWVRRGRDLVRAANPRAAVERLDGAVHVRALKPAVRQRGRYDLVVVEHAGLAPLARARRPGERWVLTVHNVQSASYEQALRDAHGRQAWLVRRRVAQARRFERGLPVGFDRVLTVSADDAAALAFATTVVPNGVDTARFAPSPLPAAPTALFSGTFSFAPNVDGAQWLCDRIWPAVRAAVPDAQLRLVGRDPVAEVRALAGRPGVGAAWDVPDIRGYVHDARVCLVPLRQGSGTRLKVLEALAVARPVVGTTVGLAGLGIADGREALVRDDPETFAQAVVAALTDDALAGRLAAAGPPLAARYDWAPVGERFLAAVLD